MKQQMAIVPVKKEMYVVGTVYITNNGKGGIIMNEFFKLAEQLVEKNPSVDIKVLSEEDMTFWKIIVSVRGKIIMNLMGKDLDLLFQNAYHKLQVHRKELL